MDCFGWQHDLLHVSFLQVLVPEPWKEDLVTATDPHNATSLPFVFLELLPTEVFGHVIRRQVGLVRHPHPVKPAEGDHQGLALEGCAVQVVPGQMIDYSINCQLELTLRWLQRWRLKILREHKLSSSSES